MKSAKLGLVAMALSGAALCSGVAQATPFTLNFEGVVTQVQFDPYDVLNGAVQPGSALYTYLNFDTAATDAATSPRLGSYTLSGGTYGMAAVVGSVVFPVMTSVNISVVDGDAGAPDQYSVFAWQGVDGGLGDYFTMSMLLEDDSGSAITGDALPTTMPDLSRFAVRGFNLAGQYTDINGTFFQYEVLGTLGTAVAVPEPGVIPLVALALLGSAFASRQGRATVRPDDGSASICAPT